MREAKRKKFEAKGWHVRDTREFLLGEFMRPLGISINRLVRRSAGEAIEAQVRVRAA